MFEGLDYEENENDVAMTERRRQTTRELRNINIMRWVVLFFIGAMGAQECKNDKFSQPSVNHDEIFFPQPRRGDGAGRHNGGHADYFHYHGQVQRHRQLHQLVSLRTQATVQPFIHLFPLLPVLA